MKKPQDYMGMFHLGVPFMTDWSGSVHARNVRFLGVWMPVREALGRLPEMVELRIKESSLSDIKALHKTVEELHSLVEKMPVRRDRGTVEPV